MVVVGSSGRPSGAAGRRSPRCVRPPTSGSRRCASHAAARRAGSMDAGRRPARAVAARSARPSCVGHRGAAPLSPRARTVDLLELLAGEGQPTAQLGVERRSRCRGRSGTCRSEQDGADHEPSGPGARGPASSEASVVAGRCARRCGRRRRPRERQVSGARRSSSRSSCAGSRTEVEMQAGHGQRSVASQVVAEAAEVGGAVRGASRVPTACEARRRRVRGRAGLVVEIEYPGQGSSSCTHVGAGVRPVRPSSSA